MGLCIEMHFQIYFRMEGIGKVVRQNKIYYGKNVCDYSTHKRLIRTLRELNGHYVLQSAVGMAHVLR